MGSQPGIAGSQFPGEDAMGRRVKDLERQMQQVMATNPLATAGISAVANGIIVQGSETVNGPLTINGPATITGTLSLPAGIIGNDALASPLTTGSAGYTASNQSFNTTTTQYGTQTITVPTGFTRAVVMNGVSAGGTNSGAGGDFLYVASGINSVAGGEMPSSALAGAYASGSAFGVRTLTGLTAGATISVSVQVRTGTGTWAAAAANIANVNALAIFYR